MNGATRSAIWLNTVMAMLAILPNLIEPLKQSLPTHYFGILSAVVTLANVGLATYSAQIQKSGNPEIEK